MIRRGGCPAGLAVTLALLAAFLAAGLAHRVPLPPRSPALAAFFAVGGSPDDLCGGAAHAEQRCEACRLVAATVPSGPGEPEIRTAWTAHRPPPAPAERARVPGREGPLPARGPPSRA